MQRIQLLSKDDICFWIARPGDLGSCEQQAQLPLREVHRSTAISTHWGIRVGIRFSFLSAAWRHLLTGHHSLRFYSQGIASSPWGTGWLEGPETGASTAETRWDAIKTTLFHLQENIALSDTSSFSHPCCHPVLFYQTFWCCSPGSLRGAELDVFVIWK